MKRHFFFAATVFALALSARAQIPSAEKLLPNDTLILLSVPDATKFRTVFKSSCYGQLWNEPSMKPFKDKFVTKLMADVVAPLEKEFGVKFSDYEAMAQGQFTFALTRNGWQGKTNESLGWILLLDTKDKSGLLKSNLTELKKKWIDSGKQIKTDKVRDVEFTTLITSTEDISKIMEKVFPRAKSGPAEEPKSPSEKIEIMVGQSGSLLLVGNSAKVIEQILVHQVGGLAPSLSDEAAYDANHNAMFRDAPLYAWLNVKPLLEAFSRETPESSSSNPLMPKPDKIISATGLNGLKTVAFSYRNAAEGMSMQLSLGIPEANRTGLFKMLAAEPKEATAPAFVPADVTKFTRWRINLPKAWTGLETMLTEISPAVGGAFKLIFESAGKDKDPNFDLKKELVGNLADDLINYQKKPTASTAAGLNSPPSIYLLGSANPDKLANAMKVGLSLLSPAPIKDRDFLGRKIYTMAGSPLLAGDSTEPPRGLEFSASGGYLALSTDTTILEEFLRSSETKAKPLTETVGFKEAAEKVGGTALGLFGINNYSEEMRATWTALKKDSATLSDLLKNPALGPKTPAEQNQINAWADFSLLPQYDSVAKYFHFSVYGGNFNADGFTVKFFYPTPPLLK